MNTQAVKLTLGEQVTLLRKRAGLTQAALAEKANVSRVWLNMLEKDSASMTLSTLQRVVGALGYSLNISIVSAEATLKESEDD